MKVRNEILLLRNDFVYLYYHSNNYFLQLYLHSQNIFLLLCMKCPCLIFYVLSLTLFLSLSFFRYLSHTLSHTLSVCLSVCLFCLFVCLSFCLSVCLSVLLSVSIIGWFDPRFPTIQVKYLTSLHICFYHYSILHIF